MSLRWQAPLLHTCCVVGFLPPSSLPPLLLSLPFTLQPLPFFWLPSLSKATNSIFPTSLQHWLIPPQLVLTPCQAIFICHLSLANTVHTYPHTHKSWRRTTREYLSISSSETRVYTYRYVSAYRHVQCLFTYVCLCIHTSMPLHTGTHPSSHTWAHRVHILQFTHHFPLSPYTSLCGRTYCNLHFAHRKTEAQK